MKFLEALLILAATAGPPCFSATPAAAARCEEPQLGQGATALLSPPLGKKVIGAGRLQFYSAPDPACRMTGVFVVPGDELVAYGETDDGWTSVMYLNVRTGSSPTGWVKSSRLKTTGTMGPVQ